MNSKLRFFRATFQAASGRGATAPVSTILLTSLACVLLASTCFADPDPSTIVVPYSSSGNRTLGDAVNIAFPYTPLGRCVQYNQSDVKFDTAGAQSSDGTLAVASTDDTEKKTTDLTLGFQTSDKIKGDVFDANSTFSLDGTTESLRSTDDKTLTLQFSANADYGRLMIENYKIDPSAPSPVSALDTFRQRCGSHFIRGESRASDLTILVRITTSTKQGKDALTANLTQTLGGGISLSDISGQASATIHASYKSIIEYARKFGTVNVEYRAHGGPGIAAAGAAAKLTDPSDLDKISNIVGNVSSMFHQDDSAITGYLLQSNTALGAPDVTFDLDRIQKIGGLTRTLIRLTDAESRYQEIKNRYPQIYSDYFQPYSDQINVLRAQVTAQIKVCASGGDCTSIAANALDGLAFLEDMFVSADVSLSCQYQHASILLPPAGKPSVDPMILESVSINLTGRSHDPDQIDFTSTGVIRLTPDNNIIDETPAFSGFSLSALENKTERRVFGTVYSDNIKPQTAITYDNSVQKYIIDSPEIQRRRDYILNSTFAVYAASINGGFKTSYDIGFPPRGPCPPMK